MRSIARGRLGALSTQLASLSNARSSVRHMSRKQLSRSISSPYRRLNLSRPLEFLCLCGREEVVPERKAPISVSGGIGYSCGQLLCNLAEGARLLLMDFFTAEFGAFELSSGGVATPSLNTTAFAGTPRYNMIVLYNVWREIIGEVVAEERQVWLKASVKLWRRLFASSLVWEEFLWRTYQGRKPSTRTQPSWLQRGGLLTYSSIMIVWAQEC